MWNKKNLAWVLFPFLASCSGSLSCLPNFKLLKTHYPKIIYQGAKKPVRVEITRAVPPQWVPLSQISKEAQWAILVSEDWAFYQHEGIDEKQIKDAVEASLREGKLKRGASTITQQVVKNIYLSSKKSITRKLREIWIAKKIETVLGKKRILEIYLNIAEMGEGVFGIGQASQLYFHKAPSRLNAKEGAFLAMLLPSPKKHSISFRQHQLTPYAMKTMSSVMSKLVQARIITQEEKNQQWSVPLSFESKNNEGSEMTLEERSIHEDDSHESGDETEYDGAVLEDN